MENNSQVVVITSDEQEDVQNLIKRYKENCESVRKIATMVSLNETIPKQTISMISQSEVVISSNFIHSVI